MNSTWNAPSEEQPGVARIEGAPESSDGVYTDRERTRWQAFCSWCRGLFHQTDGLAREYGQSRVSSETNAARKTAEEATEIAARTGKIEADTDLVKQQVVKEFTANLRMIGELPELEKSLALAKLMQQDPALAGQFEVVKDMLQQLRLTKGVVLSPLPPGGLIECAEDSESARETRTVQLHPGVLEVSAPELRVNDGAEESEDAPEDISLL
jgi:hypothetical protein